ncbi:MAG: 23S rRNA (adenine(2503)-C(2))-methyltransferase RlmN [Clostridia bacterium]|nr:23S rRNA (adenine(2503)-C(2))-methyltransferase RlmN [Clostridia bacterium]
MIDLRSMEYDELEAFLKDLGEPKYRAKQIFSWLMQGVDSFDEMTNISKKTRELLSEKSYISKLKIREKYVSKLDGTIKYLFTLDDGNCIETVIMRYHHGITVCISSQVGCRMGCGFCASTIGGLYRSLTAGEILNQVIYAQKDIGERISNIVMMGIGEPLDNYDNVIKFLHNVNHPDGLNIGYRHISLSTCGLVDKIYRLAEENLPITLSVSLHAPNNEIRDSIMPVNHKYKIEELIKACREYINKTTRRISFEYSLISGVNDSVENACELAELLKGMLCHINLIPVNHVEERDYHKSKNSDIKKFRDKLIQLGMNVTIRRELGSDISASCGQLRKKLL